jgi:hypothetical protein
MSKLNEINYQPLLVIGSAWKFVFQSTIKLWAPITVLIFVGVTFAVSAGLAFGLAMGIAILYGAMVSTRATKLKNGMWWQFAKANGWFLDTETPLEAVTPPSVLFGPSQTHSPIIQAQLENLTCDLFTYSCITGYGRSEQVHNFTVACVSLPQTLPHMLLLSKQSHALVQRDLGNAEKLQLEGDFSDYFTVEIEKGQETNALTIITPDVMQTLVTYNQAEDIEILGSNLYFILNKDERDYRDMRALIQSVAELSGKILQNLKLATPTSNPPA